MARENIVETQAGLVDFGGERFFAGTGQNGVQLCGILMKYHAAGRPVNNEGITRYTATGADACQRPCTAACPGCWVLNE